jgi:hypothetical protein
MMAHPDAPGTLLHDPRSRLTTAFGSRCVTDKGMSILSCRSRVAFVL